MSLALFASSQSASFQCQYSSSSWGSLGKIYECIVQNVVNITSLDAAQVDSISGQHLTGYNNDNVEAIDVYQKGQVHYFPRGLNKIFKNLKGISIGGTGLKEIHQSDLKDFPKLKNLFLYENDLEIIEENLFKFNPNLEFIDLSSNKISHIDPNVFDKLTKLKTLDLKSNTCINMSIEYNRTAIQRVIKKAKEQCQKVKKLDENAQETTTTPKTTTIATTTTSESSNEPELSQFETCSALQLKIDNIRTTLKDLLTQTGNGTCNIGNDKDLVDSDHSQSFYGDLRNQKDTKLEILEEQIKNTIKDAHNDLMQTMNLKFDKIEKQIEEQNQKLETIEKHIVRMMRAFYINV